MFWRLYFWLMIVVSILDIALRIFVSHTFFEISPQQPGFSFITILTWISLLGLYGFVFQKKYLWAYFWKIFFVVVIAGQVIDIISDIRFVHNLDPQSFSLISELFDSLIFNLISVPFFVAIYRYGFKSSSIWGNCMRPGGNP